MMPDEKPVYLHPDDGRVVKSLDGPVAPPFLCPAGDAQHCHPARQGYYGWYDTIQLS